MALTKREYDLSNDWMKDIRNVIVPGMEFYANIRAGSGAEIVRRWCKVVTVYDRFIEVEHKTLYEDRYRICYQYDDITKVLAGVAV